MIRLRPPAFTPATFVILVVVPLVALVVAVYYRYHLQCVIGAYRLEEPFSPVPSTQMPVVDVPDGWVSLRHNELALRVPRELAEAKEVPDVMGNQLNPGSVANLAAETRVIAMAGPEDYAGTIEFAEAELGIKPIPQEYTLPGLTRACFELDTRDFRWSMTRDEARRHAYLTSIGRFVGGPRPDRIESFVRDDLDCLLSINGANRATLVWQSKRRDKHRRQLGGLLFFREAEQLDLDWVRAVCGSIEIAYD